MARMAARVTLKSRELSPRRSNTDQVQPRSALNELDLSLVALEPPVSWLGDPYTIWKHIRIRN